MSPDARLMCGIGLILIPTIVYGGLTVLYVISNGKLGPGGPRNLTPDQASFYRAGHAHAGVLTLLALLMQILLDYVALPPGLVWPLRIGVIAGALLRVGGIFRGGACARASRVALSGRVSRGGDNTDRWNRPVADALMRREFAAVRRWLGARISKLRGKRGCV